MVNEMLTVPVLTELKTHVREMHPNQIITQIGIKIIAVMSAIGGCHIVKKVRKKFLRK